MEDSVPATMGISGLSSEQPGKFVGVEVVARESQANTELVVLQECFFLIAHFQKAPRRLVTKLARSEIQSQCLRIPAKLQTGGSRHACVFIDEMARFRELRGALALSVRPTEML
jgi:hypothetical protein